MSDVRSEVTSEEEAFAAAVAAEQQDADTTPADPPAPEGEAEPAPEAAKDGETGETAPEPAEPAPAVTDAEAEELVPGFNALPPETQAAIKERIAAAEAARLEAENRWKRQHNQLVPTQRELEKTRRAAQQMAQRLKELEAKPATAANKRDTAAVLAKFREQFPDEAEALEALNDDFSARAELLARQSEEAREKLATIEAHLHQQRAVAILSERHPDFREIDASPTFKEWFNAASPWKQALARSSDPTEVAEALDDYKRDMALAMAINGQPQGSTATAKPPQRKPEADPNPTARHSGARPANADFGLSEEDRYAAAVQASR